MADARFEDGVQHPLNLVARDEADLAVLSSLVQDAVLSVADLRWVKTRRRFAVLINRFRWEDRTAPGPERVRSLLVLDDVQAVRAQGFDRRSPDLVLSLLSMSFAPGAEGSGVITLTFAGDGALALGVEALEVSLKDVTRPYLAPSRQRPTHPD